MMGRVFYRLAVGVIFIFLIGPLLMVILTSLSAQSALIFPPRALTMRWYYNIPQPFIDSTIVSIKVATITTFIAVLLSVPAAIALVRTPLPGKPAISALCLSPLLVPALIIGVALFQATVVMWDYSRLSLDGTITILVLGHLTFAIPFVLRAVIVGFAQFDPSIEEAAQSLGAGRVETFFKITLPMLRPGIVSGAIFSFFMSLDDVPIALLLGSGNNTTLPVRIFSAVEFSFGNDIMMVSSIIIIASMAILLIVDRVVGVERVFGSKL